MKNILLITLLILLASCGKEKRKEIEEINEKENKLKVVINAKVLENDVFEVYFYESGDETFNSKDYVFTKVEGMGENQNIVFNIPDNIYPERLRLDFGKIKTQKPIELNTIKLVFNSKEYIFDKEEIINEFKPSRFIDFDKESFVIKTKEIKGRYDPYFYTKKLNNIINYLLED